MKINSGGVTGLLSFLDTLQQGKGQRQQQQQQFSQEKLQSEQRMAEGRRADATYKRGVDAENRGIDQYNRELADYNANAPIRDLTRAQSLFDLKAKLPKERLQLKTQWMDFEGKQKEQLKPLIAKLTDRNLSPGAEAIIRGQIEDITRSNAEAKKLFGEHAQSLNLGDIFSDSKWEAPDLLSLGGLKPTGQQQGLPVGQGQNVGMDNADIYNWMDMKAAPQAPGANAVLPTSNNVQVGQGTGMGGGLGTNVGNAGMGEGMEAGTGAGNVSQNPPPPPPTEYVAPTDKPATPPVNKISVADILAGKEYKIEKDTTLTAADKEAFRKGLKDRGINEYEAGAYDFKPARYNMSGGVYRASNGQNVAVGELIPAEVAFNPVKATQIALPKVVNYIRDWASTNKVTPYQAQVALGLDQPEIQLFNEKNEPQLQNFLSDGAKAVAALTSIYNRSTDVFNPTETSRTRAEQRGKDSLKGAESVMEGVRDDIKRRFEEEQKNLDRLARSIDTKNEADQVVLDVSRNGINLGRAKAYSKEARYRDLASSIATATPDAKTAILQSVGIISGTLPSGVTPDQVGKVFSVIAAKTMEAKTWADSYKPTSSLASLQKLQSRMDQVSQLTAEKVRKTPYYTNAPKELKNVIDGLLGQE